MLLKGCKCVTGCKSRVCGCRKKDIKCSEGCQCTNCENYGLPPQDREDLANVALQERAQSSSTSDEEHTDEFAEFVFAAATFIPFQMHTVSPTYTEYKLIHWSHSLANNTIMRI